ncbi:PRC and DUF2382 domain-containing protein [Rathayibacter sp. YIM 133350]|uniref:PRC and DUF2382 domain-containing protein n=1 Tax=Rathayibacter sp. YIM 133350 TaxID=3131992 RepID=UPI00307FCCBB
MIDNNNLASVIGATVYGNDGDKIGKAGQVYVDDNTGRPLWASVHTGLFGTSETLVPLEGADFNGENLTIGFDKSVVKDAPRVDLDGAISPEEQDELYRYYNLGGVHGDVDSDVDTSATTGHDTSGPNTDSAMTRSEERLDVGTEKVATGRARLRKHIVTEEQTVTVPVSHEEVRLEREPITEENIGAATSGPDLSEEEHEVVLTGERVVVNKETVPVERVRLDTDTVTEQQTVTEGVRKEEIDLAHDAK